MVDFLKQVAFTGIGLASLTKDKVVELGKQAAEAGKMSEEEGRKFVEELQDRAKKEKEKLDERVTDQVKKAIEKLDLPTKNDFDDLKNQIAVLTKLMAKDEKAE